MILDIGHISYVITLNEMKVNQFVNDFESITGTHDLIDLVLIDDLYRLIDVWFLYV